LIEPNGQSVYIFLKGRIWLIVLKRLAQMLVMKQRQTVGSIVSNGSFTAENAGASI